MEPQQPISGETTITVRPTEGYALYQVALKIMAAIVFSAVGLYTGRLFICFLSIPFLALAIYRYLYVLHTTYRITSQQLIFEKGIFSKDKQYLELYRVRDFDFHQDLVMRLLNLQKITLLTFDKGDPLVSITGVPNSDLVQVIRDRVQDCRRKNKILTMDN